MFSVDTILMFQTVLNIWRCSIILRIPSIHFFNVYITGGAILYFDILINPHLKKIVTEGNIFSDRISKIVHPLSNVTLSLLCSSLITQQRNSLEEMSSPWRGSD